MYIIIIRPPYSPDRQTHCTCASSAGVLIKLYGCGECAWGSGHCLGVQHAVITYNFETKRVDCLWFSRCTQSEPLSNVCSSVIMILTSCVLFEV